METTVHPLAAKLVTGFAARLSRRGLAQGTMVKYRDAAIHWVEWLGERGPAEATRADVEQYLDDWAPGLAPATVRMRIASLKSFYDYLDSIGLLPSRSPLDGVDRPRVGRRPNDRLSPAEDSALLDGPRTPRERIVVHLLRWTGLRISEACALTWEDVDMERGEIRVRRSKTASGVRTVPLLPELAPELESWRRDVERRGLYSPRGPVLVTRLGNPMVQQYTWRLVKRVAERAGVRARPAPDRSGHNVSEVAEHTLRRTFACDLLNRGVRLEVVSQVLGHSDTRVTQRFYAELLDQTVRDEVLRAFAG